RVAAFAKVLHDGGIVTTIRKTRGDDIAAACGQLAGEVQDRTRVAERRARAASVRVAAPTPQRGRQRAGSPRMSAPILGASLARAGALAIVLAALHVACTTQNTIVPVAGAPDRIGSTDEGDAKKRSRARLELASAYFSRGE